MKNKTNPIEHFDPEELIFWSFRYFLGRMTASTCDYARSLSFAWDGLGAIARNRIAQELEEEFKRDDEYRAENLREHGNQRHYLPLGNDCDRAAWELVRNKYKT